MWVQCFILPCQEKINMVDLVEHLGSPMHKTPVFHNNSIKPWFNAKEHPSMVMYKPEEPEWHKLIFDPTGKACSYPGSDVLFYLEKVRQCGNWYFWIYANGKHEEAEKFTFKITFRVEINFATERNNALAAFGPLHLQPVKSLNIPEYRRESFPIPVISNLRRYEDIMTNGPVLKFTDQFVEEKLRDYQQLEGGMYSMLYVTLK